jgi:hypothetical protein
VIAVVEGGGAAAPLLDQGPIREFWKWWEPGNRGEIPPGPGERVTIDAAQVAMVMTNQIGQARIVLASGVTQSLNSPYAEVRDWWARWRTSGGDGAKPGSTPDPEAERMAEVIRETGMPRTKERPPWEE